MDKSFNSFKLDISIDNILEEGHQNEKKLTIKVHPNILNELKEEKSDNEKDSGEFMAQTPQFTPTTPNKHEDIQKKLNEALNENNVN